MKFSPVALAVFCDSERDASSAGDGNALFVRQGSSHQSRDFGVAILALSASIHSRLTKTQATIVGSAQREHLKDISTFYMFKKIVVFSPKYSLVPIRRHGSINRQISVIWSCTFSNTLTPIIRVTAIPLNRV